jgi:hypothetical protein
MSFRFSLAFLTAAILLSAAPKKTSGSGHGENEDLILTATLYTSPADIQNLVGSDLGGHYFVAEVKVEPKYGKDVTVDRDDFVLRTDRDGEREQPYEGSQIAGRTSLVVGRATAPVIGPNSSRVQVNKSASMKSEGNEDAPNPLQKTLDGKILPTGKTDKPVSGLLYFPMEKQKLKDLELLYGGKENRISLRFKLARQTFHRGDAEERRNPSKRFLE